MLGTIEGLPDLTEPDFYLGNPYPAYHRLHREAPVYWHPHRHSKRGGFWLVSGHAPLSWASRHPEAYSSLEGLALDGPDTEMINLMLSGSIICTDPPVHRDFRRLLLDVFKPTAMENLESVIRSHTRELLDRIPVGEPFDLVETVAARCRRGLSVSCSARRPRSGRSGDPGRRQGDAALRRGQP